jgi:hypothetical protein
LSFLPQRAQAQTEVDTRSLEAEIACARRELAAAKIEARHYWQVEYPACRRDLNAEIDFADTEVRTLRREIRKYAPFHSWAWGQLPALGYRDLEPCLKDAETRYRSLVDERNNLQRNSSDQLALLNLRVAEARDRVIALEGGGLIEFEPGKVVEPAPVVE